MTDQNTWEQYIDALRPIAARLRGRAWGIEEHAEQEEINRALFAAVTQAFLNYAYANVEYPDWMPAYDYAINLMAPVPDYRYKVCLIEGQGTYRVSGFRGTSRFVDLTVFTSLFSLGKTGPVSTRISLDSLELGEQGRYEFILSPQRPVGYRGQWFELDPRAIRLQVRHASYDWFNEIDARMAIERLDRPAPKPRERPEQLAAKFAKVATWVENTVSFGIDHVRKQAQKGLINKLEPIDWGAIGGFDPKIQAYVEGLFDLAEDEALVLETELPQTARYWSFLLSDPLFATIDWMNRQSSLNGHQARIDNDGRVRMVVARRDPGVPNWLDTGDYPRGVIQVRWNECSSQPTPSIRKLKLAEVRSALPEDTPTVTAAQRDDQLRRRREGAQMRSRW
jgi:hypothetical protein